MFEQYIVKNLSSFEDDESFKCPTLAYAELERRQAQGIECDVFFASSYDTSETIEAPIEDTEVGRYDLAQETGIQAISGLCNRYSE